MAFTVESAVVIKSSDVLHRPKTSGSIRGCPRAFAALPAGPSAPLSLLSQASMEHVRPLSAFCSVSVANFCFSKTVFSAMFVKDVENAADRRRLLPTCPPARQLFSSS